VAVADEAILARLQAYLRAFGIDLAVAPFDSGERGGTKPLYKLETRSQPKLAVVHGLYDEPGKEYARGWLAGMLDAEGCNSSSLRIANTNEEYLQRVVQFGEMLGFTFKIEHFKSHTKTARFYGNSQDRHALFSLLQPALLRKTGLQMGTCMEASSSKVVALEDVGQQDLIDIQTSSGTFFANGLATHNCYMFRDQLRYGRDPAVVVRTKTWGDPLRWQKKAEAAGRTDLVFTCSWSDWFHADADAWRPEAWAVVRRCPNLVFQVLTKRPERIREHLPPDWGEGYKNVWLGVSVERNDYIWRADALRAIPARTRWVCAEPLLGPLPDLSLDGIDWLVVGGETGPDWRPLDLHWVRELRDRCRSAGVAFYFKQANGPYPGMYPRLDGKLHQEMPEVPTVPLPLFG
jgi:protein gp37